MSTVHRIAKNTSMLLIAQIVTYLLSFFTTMYMARYLGAENFGILSLALSITAIFGIVVDMGLSTLLIREVARNTSLLNKYIFNVFVMKIFLSFLMIGLIVLSVNLIGYSTTVSTVIYLITVSTIIWSFVTFLSSVFQANEKMEHVSLSTVLNSILLLSGTLIGIYYNMNIFYFAALYIISYTLVFIYIDLAYLKTFFIPQFKIDLSFWKPTLKEAWPFGITGLSGMLYTYIDSIMLSIIQGNAVVGWYSAAYRLILVVLFIPNAANMAIFPIMSKFYTSSPDSLKMMYERYFKYMIVIGIPIGFGTTILADKIILLIFGPGYVQSIIALQILIWTMVFTFAGASFVQLLQSINKQLILTKISGICVIINILLNLALIPKFSYIGASFATVLTEIVLVGYIFFATYKLGYEIPYKLVITDLLKVIAAALVMSMFIWYFKDLNLFLLIITSTLVYFTAIYFVKGIDDVDLNLLKQLKP
jgi:O-antigen/teichoic acid export membrane protein